MWKYNRKESSKKDVHTSDSDENEETNWDKELLRAVRLKIEKSNKDPEQIIHSLVKAVLHGGADPDIHNQNPETAIALAGTLQKKDIVGTLRTPIDQRTIPEFSRSSEANDFISEADEREPSSSQGGDMATRQEPTTVEDGTVRNRPRKELHPGEHKDKAEKVPGSEKPETYLANGTLISSWPGILYQWKHLAFTLHCALQQKEPRFLLAMEMVAAEKLDDIILQYKNDSGEQVGRFVQIKYTSTRREKISAEQLLRDSGDFSVPTYFASWCKLKKKKIFADIEVRNMILCTNMDLDLKNFKNLKDLKDSKKLAGLKDNYICYEDAEEPDKSFELKSSQERTAWYKFPANEEFNEKLYRKLKATSPICRLAKLVAKCTYDKKPLRSEMEGFRDHHLTLKKYVFDSKAGKFHDKFIHNISLPAGVGKFREIFLTEFRSMGSVTCASEEAAWTEIQTRCQKPQFPRDSGKAPEDAADSLTKDDLPDDFDDVDISNFLEEFRLTVNQPNKDELDKILKEKIDANGGFNLLNTELLDGAFQTKMLDWFVKEHVCEEAVCKHRKEQQEYFSYKVGEKFFKDMNDEVGSLITIGVNSVYCEQMKEYDVHFKSEIQRVKAFLTKDGSDSTTDRILELVAPEGTFLTALGVYDTLGRIQKYKKMDSFIFISVKHLKLPRTLKNIKNTFDSLRYPDLLIVDCESNGEDQYLQTLWNSLCEIIEKNVQKKMIVITRTGENLGPQFRLGHKTRREKNIVLGFRNLTNSTQKKLLEKPVTKFQGHENRTSLGELLGICQSDNLSPDESEDLSEIIDSNALVEIIRGDQLMLGNDLAEMDTPENCYIHRKIYRDVVIKETIVEDEKIPDLIAISGNDGVLSGLSLRMEGTFLTRRNFPNDLFADSGIDTDCPGKSGQTGKSSPMAHLPTNVIILDSTRAKEHFNDLCAENEGCNVHWLQKEQGRYIWKKSQGDIAYLVEHQDASETDVSNDKTDATFLGEDQLTFDDEPVIISDMAGMGKSTMLTHLACKMKENEPDMLVLKIDLNHHTPALAEVIEKSSYDLSSIHGAVQFLVKEVLSRETNLTRKVYEIIMKRKHKVALIFDGFDDISPTYEDLVIDLLQTLVSYGIKKLLVATRPHTRSALETKLNAFSYKIQSFSTDDQKRFLTKFWQAKFRDLDSVSQQTVKDRIEKYATAMMNKLANFIGDQGHKLTGIPLQAQQVAKIFGDHSERVREHFVSCEEFIHSEDDEPEFPKKINLIYLYETFVEKQFDIFFKTIGGDPKKPGVKAERERRFNSFKKEHERLALYTLFDQDKITKLLYSQQDERDRSPEPAPRDPIERNGIVTQSINGQPRFVHRTYAEYFAAKFFSNMVRKRRQTEPLGKIFVADILLRENHKTMRAFIDSLLLDEQVDLLRGEFWKYHLKTYRSRLEETIFHVAAAEGNHCMIRLFLNCLYADNGDREDLVHVKDIFGRTAVHPAVEYGHLDTIKLLVEDTEVAIDYRDIFGVTPLIQAAFTANIDVIKYLIHKRADVNCQTNDGVTPLHLAAQNSKLDMVEFLCENKADVNCQRKGGVMPLHLAAQNSKLDMVEFLCENKADVNCQRKDGVTPLHLAAQNGNLNIVKYLRQNGADVNCQTNDRVTPLQLAAQNGELDTVKFLCENEADVNCRTNDGVTPLHLAVQSGKLDTVKFLCGDKADVNCQRKDGVTPLHWAVHYGELDTVKFLCENKADVNCQRKDGMTPLHLAAQNGKLDTVKFLCENKAHVNCQRDDGVTPLHLATQDGKLDVVKYLRENGADINCQANEGLRPLHVAAQNGKLVMVKYLRENGADVNCQWNDGVTPLHLAAQDGELDIVKYLCENGADVNCQTNDGLTPLHLAALKGDLDIVQYLPENGADVNRRANDGPTPLHLAALKGNLDVVKSLIDKGAKLDT